MKKVNCIMRLKRDANKGANIFFKSKKTDLKTFIIVDGEFIPIRYVKYFIDGKIFMIATSLFEKSVKHAGGAGHVQASMESRT